MENTNSNTQQLSTWQWLLLSSLPIVFALIDRITILPLNEMNGSGCRPVMLRSFN